MEFFKAMWPLPLIAVVGLALLGLWQGMKTQEKAYSDSQVNESLVKIIDAVSSSQEDKKNALIEMILASTIHPQKAIPVEEVRTFSGSTISYQVTENNDLVIATLNPETGSICAASSNPIETIGGCISQENEPDAFKDPLESIISNPQLWNS